MTLRLDDLRLTRGATHVLDGVSLEARAGEFISILGPSGAGKSTLFELLLGSLEPDGGQISYNDQPVQGRDLFAFMPQRDALMPWRRVIDNIALGLEVQGLPRRTARERVRPLLPRFGLDGFERHWPHQLSGGMRQRAALARTLVQDRPLLLLDEPFGALDALTRTRMQRWLEARLQETRVTTMLVTHDVREAVALSDRIYLLSPRPARVVEVFDVPQPRPRMETGPGEEALALETRILRTLLEGERE